MKTSAFLITLFFLAAWLPLTAQRSITGTVTDENGAVLVGAVVRVVGAAGGAVTGLDGAFTLNAPAGPDLRIVASYLGFADQEILIGDRQAIQIRLLPKVEDLSEVVVTGFGTQSRRRVTSAIVSAGSEDYQGMSASSFEDGLQGKLPGVVFTRSTGAQASNVVIRVRGVSSINASNQPLIVVDGLIVEGIEGIPFGNSGTNALINLDPNDIESVEVLKDGAASAIYGSRGGNGVILITTKRGKFNAPPKVNLRYYAGFSEPSNRYDVMNGPEFAAFWNQAARNVGLDESSGLIYEDVEKQPSTDWIDLVTRRAFQQETGASVSGGSNTTRYYLGGTYRREDNYYVSKGLERYSFRVNVDQLISPKVRAGISANPSRTVHQRTYEGTSWLAPNSVACCWVPNVEAFDEKGQLRRDIIYTDIGTGGTAGNPLINLLENNNRLTTTQLLLNTYVEYAPTASLTFRTELGTEFTQTEEIVRWSSATTWGYPNGYGIAQSQQSLSYNWTFLSTYRYSFSARHEVDATLGVNLTERSFSGQATEGRNFPDDRLAFINAAADITYGSSSQTDNAFAGFFGRLNYAMAGKYLLTLTGRYDGSSRFGARNRFGFFPALSAGWIVSEEPFFRNKLVNFLKLRGSVGLSGNGEIFDFAGRSLIEFGWNYAGGPGAILATLENDELKWEKTRQIDAGLEFGLFNNRLRGTLGYFVKDTRDLLLNVPLPGTTGITYTLQNAGAVRNQGFEFDLNAEVLSGPFQWTLSLNGATLKNEIRKLVDNNGDGQDDDIVNGPFIFRTGEPINAWYLARYAGVDRQNGDALFLGKDDEIVRLIPPPNGRVVAGTAIPAFTGGITNRFQFKGFDLTAFFQISLGYQLFRSESYYLENGLALLSNQLRTLLQAWTPENPDTDIPQARLNTPNGHLTSTRFLDNGDFLRLRNLQLGYTFRNLGKRQSSLRLYASAQNLWLLTDYEGLEPEASTGWPGSPLSGFQNTPSPQPRTVIFGITLDL